MVLGHGAGGGVGARDLVAVGELAVSLSISVALVEQPYRVAGRRSPAPAKQLDAAWLAVLAQLRERSLRGLPVIAGGRSSGARVACRTAEAAGCAAVLCLAFPLLPPARGRASATSRQPETRQPERRQAEARQAGARHPETRQPERRQPQSRLPELEAVSVPMLVVQGERDPFGMPPPGPRREVVRVAGDHALRDTGAVRGAVAAWLGACVLPGLDLIPQAAP